MIGAKNRATTLSAIASVHHGHPFRSRIEESSEGNVEVIQMRDLDYNTRTINRPLTRVHLPEPTEKMLLRNGDILFSGRGANNVAILVESLEGPTVAPSMLYVLRVHDRKVDPRYLAWYINQETAQRFLLSRAMGTTMPVINKKDLIDLPIPLPELAEQKTIAAVASLIDREAELLDRLKSLRTSFVNTLLLEKAEEATS